jgi:ABC-type Fe3+ transport system permease subunit
MTRILLVLLAILLPILVYWLYDRIMKRRDAYMGPEPWHARAPWARLLAAGVALAALLLFVMVLVKPTAPVGTYVPPAWLQGKIVPGHVEKGAAP